MLKAASWLNWFPGGTAHISKLPEEASNPSVVQHSQIGLHLYWHMHKKNLHFFPISGISLRHKDKCKIIFNTCKLTSSNYPGFALCTCMH